LILCCITAFISTNAVILEKKVAEGENEGESLNAWRKNDDQNYKKRDSEDQSVIVSEVNATGCINACSENGYCSNVTYSNGVSLLECNCFANRAHDDCSYPRKSKLLSFIFSFLFGYFGVDRFYLGYNEIGLFKLLFTIMICAIPCLPLYCVCCMDEEATNALYSFVIVAIICFFIGMWIWWFVDWILIVSDSLPDANGVSLDNDM